MVGMGNERDVDVAYICEATEIRGLENPGDEVIVQIDTGERTKHLRVMLNEAIIYEGDPEVAALPLAPPPGDDEVDQMIGVHTSALSEHLMSTTETDTLDRARRRMALIFEMFYDDEEGEPDQAIRDLLTDVMHEASAREVDMEDAVHRAASMFGQEVEEWSDRDD